MPGLSSEQLAGKVLQGTCGWSDPSINAWYPPAYNKSAEHRLPYYCRHFPCVEVDSSCYKIPSADQVARWVKQVLPGFRFHFKVFGLHCQQSCAFGALPKHVRQTFFPDKAAITSMHPEHVALSDFPTGAEQACWDAFNTALEPVVKAGHMGCVVFQFQLGFKPTDDNRAYILHCRDRLRADVPMAIEFRNRSWFQAPEAMTKLVAWCTAHDLALIAADELRHETYGNQRDKRQGLAPDEVPQILPMSLAVTRPDFLYVRLHRRQGTTQRLLAPTEHQVWADKLAHIAPALQGPIYFMWGTDWSDAPVVNAAALSKALPPELYYDYAAVSAKLVAARPGSISALFARAANGRVGRAGSTAESQSGGKQEQMVAHLEDKLQGFAGAETSAAGAVPCSKHSESNMNDAGLHGSERQPDSGGILPVVVGLQDVQQALPPHADMPALLQAQQVMPCQHGLQQAPAGPTSQHRSVTLQQEVAKVALVSVNNSSAGGQQHAGHSAARKRPALQTNAPPPKSQRPIHAYFTKQ